MSNKIIKITDKISKMSNEIIKMADDLKNIKRCQNSLNYL
jgi:hypothetical protein